MPKCNIKSYRPLGCVLEYKDPSKKPRSFPLWPTKLLIPYPLVVMGYGVQMKILMALYLLDFYGRMVLSHVNNFIAGHFHHLIRIAFIPLQDFWEFGVPGQEPSVPSLMFWLGCSNEERGITEENRTCRGGETYHMLALFLIVLLFHSGTCAVV
jgi:hypothetical protein